MFFLVGRGRSGTELLRKILNSHSSISIAPESLFLVALRRAFAHATWSEKRVERFARAIFRDDRMRLWNVDRDALERRWRATPATTTYAARCAEVYEAHADAEGKRNGRLLGDKNPTFSLWVPELMDLYPDARFVHMVRDYRDNVLSHQQVQFDLNSVAALGYRWKYYNEAILAAAKRSPERFHLVRFKALLRSPRPILEGLCRFLGVEVEEAMFRAHERKETGVPAWHLNTARPLDTRRAGRWRRDLSENEIFMLDAICQPLGAALGYSPAGEPSRRWYPGSTVGWAATVLERILFRLPVPLQSVIMTSYRELTGSRIDETRLRPSSPTETA